MRKSAIAVAVLLSANLGMVLPVQADGKHKHDHSAVAKDSKDTKVQEAARKKAERKLAKQEREAKRQEEKAARKARLAEPRIKFRMNSTETAFRGVSVSADLIVYNAPLDDAGTASAELEIIDALDNSLALETCTAAESLPTKIDADNYRLSCRISDKGVFSASLLIRDLPFGTWSGSGRYVTNSAEAGSLPVGIGMVSLEQSAPPVAGADCQYSAWSDWGFCGLFLQQSRTRSILKEAEAGGMACDANLLMESRSC